MRKTCEECGNEYETRSKSPGRERYCSKKCYQDFSNHRHWRNHHPKLLEEELKGTCGICGKEFIRDKNHPRAICCSSECSNQRFNRIRRELTDVRREPPRHCPVCGVKFTPHKRSQNWQRFCSTKCSSKTSRQKASRENPGANREYQRKRRFDGNFLKALERDNYRCSICGFDEKVRLNIHHIDGSGEGRSPNHEMDNLATLCFKCHTQVHSFKYSIVDGEMVISGAAFDWLGLMPVRAVKSGEVE